MTFADRVRELLAERRMSVTQLAVDADLDQSVVSRLLSENSETRREPRIEHILALARALDVAPGEIVAGTEAVGVLGAWIPREELEREIDVRVAAQREASQLRRELTGVAKQLEVTKTALQNAMRRATTAESSFEYERMNSAAAGAERDALLAECERLFDVAQKNYRAWAQAHASIRQLQNAVVQAKNVARAGWAGVLITGLAAGAVLASADDPGRRSRRRS